MSADDDDLFQAGVLGQSLGDVAHHRESVVGIGDEQHRIAAVRCAIGIRQRHKDLIVTVQRPRVDVAHLGPVEHIGSRSRRGGGGISGSGSGSGSGTGTGAAH
jgi:hypothetical protein